MTLPLGVRFDIPLALFEAEVEAEFKEFIEFAEAAPLIGGKGLNGLSGEQIFLWIVKRSGRNVLLQYSQRINASSFHLSFA